MGHYYIQRAQRAWRDVLPSQQSERRQLDRPPLPRLSPEETQRMRAQDQSAAIWERNRAFAAEFLALAEPKGRRLVVQVPSGWRIDWGKRHGLEPSSIGMLLKKMGVRWVRGDAKRLSRYEMPMDTHVAVDRLWPLV